MGFHFHRVQMSENKTAPSEGKSEGKNFIGYIATDFDNPEVYNKSIRVFQKNKELMQVTVAIGQVDPSSPKGEKRALEYFRTIVPSSFSVKELKEIFPKGHVVDIFYKEAPWENRETGKSGVVKKIITMSIMQKSPFFKAAQDEIKKIFQSIQQEKKAQEGVAVEPRSDEKVPSVDFPESQNDMPSMEDMEMDEEFGGGSSAPVFEIPF